MGFRDCCSEGSLAARLLPHVNFRRFMFYIKAQLAVLFVKQTTNISIHVAAYHKQILDNTPYINIKPTTVNMRHKPTSLSSTEWDVRQIVH